MALQWAGSTAFYGILVVVGTGDQNGAKRPGSRMAQLSFNPEQGGLVPLQMCVCAAAGLKTWLFDLFTDGELNSGLALSEGYQGRCLDLQPYF